MGKDLPPAYIQRHRKRGRRDAMWIIANADACRAINGTRRTGVDIAERFLLGRTITR